MAALSSHTIDDALIAIHEEALDIANRALKEPIFSLPNLPKSTITFDVRDNFEPLLPPLSKTIDVLVGELGFKGKDKELVQHLSLSPSPSPTATVLLHQISILRHGYEMVPARLRHLKETHQKVLATLRMIRRFFDHERSQRRQMILSVLEDEPDRARALVLGYGSELDDVLPSTTVTALEG